MIEAKPIASDWAVGAKQVPDKTMLSVEPKLSSVQVARVSPSLFNEKNEIRVITPLNLGGKKKYLGDGREGTGESDSIDSEPVSPRLSCRILESRAEEADASLELEVRRREAAADSSELLLPLVVESFPISRRSRSSSLIRSMIYLSGTSPSRPSLVPFHQSLDT